MESANDDLTRQQNSVGWNGVLEGCFHRGWECVQHGYLNQMKSLRTGRKWQASVCRRIWLIPWEMWKHRNDVEHSNDTQKEIAKLDQLISEEIAKGADQSEEISQMLTAFQLGDGGARTLAYKRCWVQGVQALRRRAQRRGLLDHTLHGMRQIMRRFLLPREDNLRG